MNQSTSRSGERISDTDIADTLEDLKGMWAAAIDLIGTLPGAGPFVATRQELPPLIAAVFEQAKAAASDGEPCKATSSSYGGGAACDQKWTCEECGDVTDTERCPKGRENTTLAKLAIPSESGQHFVAPCPLPQELVAVLIHYDKITAGAPLTDAEWDFVMTAEDWRELRGFFAKLKPGGPPTVITNPPRPA